MRQLEADFAETLRRLGPLRPFALAVSGGPDSMALMRLAAGLDPIVLTVDHGLRAKSHIEAVRVAAWANDLGLRHETLRWAGPKPTYGIQAAARQARYGLLAEAAKRAGAVSLLTGHTLDDQIETVAMRQAKGSGESGLAGMPSQSEIVGNLRLVRPLLATRKSDLVAWLTGLGQPFVEDPSNTDPRFDRARLRTGVPLDVRIEDIVAAQQARAATERVALAFLASPALEDVSGGFALDPAAFAALGAPVRDAVLAALLRRVGRRDYPGTRAERERVAQAIAAGGAFPGRTLAGTVIRPARARDGTSARGRLVFMPENGGKPPLSSYWLPMGRFVQLAADGSFLTPHPPFNETKVR